MSQALQHSQHTDVSAKDKRPIKSWGPKNPILQWAQSTSSCYSKNHISKKSFKIRKRGRRGHINVLHARTVRISDRIGNTLSHHCHVNSKVLREFEARVGTNLRISDVTVDNRGFWKQKSRIRKSCIKRLKKRAQKIVWTTCFAAYHVSTWRTMADRIGWTWYKWPCSR